MIYLCMFLLSAGCIALSGSGKIHRRWTRHLLTIAGLLLPALLAGFRAASVGTDVNTYAIPYYKWAIAHPAFSEYIALVIDSYGRSVIYDQLFWFVLYLCARIVPDYHFGLFVYNLLVVVFLYLGLGRFCRILMPGTGAEDAAQQRPLSLSEPETSTECVCRFTALGMLICYLLLYNRSLNLMRLSIAVAMVFYAVAFLLEKKYVRCVVICVAALFFHSSAILAVGFFILYILAEYLPGGSLRSDLGKAAALGGLLIVLFLCITPIVTGLVDSGLLRENYLIYLPSAAYEELGLTYSWWMFLLMMIKRIFSSDGLLAAGMFVVSLGGYVQDRRRNGQESGERKIRLFLLLCAVVYLVVVMVSENTREWIRAGFYFLPLIAVDHTNLLMRAALGGTDSSLMEGTGGKSRASALMKRPEARFVTAAAVYLLFLLALWYIIFCVQGAGETSPYLFFWQT